VATQTRKRTAPDAKPPEDKEPTVAHAPKKDEDDGVLLTLSTLAPKRPTIRIITEDHPVGRLYEIKVRADFGIRDQQTLTRDGREWNALWNSDEELSDDQADRLKLLLDRMFDKVLDAPATVRKQVGDEHRAEVVTVFTNARLLMTAMAQAKAQAEQEKTDDQARDGSTTAS
jgi:hypothetical protein